MPRHFIKYAFILFTLISTLSECQPADARTIRVGYMDREGYISAGANQSYSGYGVDYLEEIAKHTGWQYEYVYAPWSKSLEMLKNKELDLLCTEQRNAENQQVYDFSLQQAGIMQYVIYTRQDNNDIFYDDYERLDDMNIGFITGDANREAFAEYASLNNFTFTKREYDTSAELEAALLAGEVDAIATGHMHRHDSLKFIGRYGAAPYYFMTYKDNSIIYDLDKAMSEIKSRNVYFEADLYKKYYGDSNIETAPTYTRAEIDFIKNSGPITVGKLPSFHPISDYDSQTGVHSGIVYDIMQQISTISGLKFTYESIPEKQRPIAMLKQGHYDMVVGFTLTANFLNDPEIMVSNRLFDTQLSVVCRRGESYDPYAPLTAALLESQQAVAEYLAVNNPRFKIITRATFEACLEAVMDNEADLTVQNAYLMNYLLQSPRYERLQMLPTRFIEQQMGAATLSNADPRLISIINKTMPLIYKNSLRKIIIDNTVAKPYKMTLSDIYYRYKAAIITFALLSLVCIGLLAHIYRIRQRNLRDLRKKNEQLTTAIRQAENANNAKSVFLSCISHEIRTPMNAIVGLTAIAHKHINEPLKIREYLDKISSSSNILLMIINDVLDMSAIDNNKLKLANTPFDFKQLLTSITSLYYSQCAAKNIKFEMILNKITEETLIGDSLRVNQIMLNLLSNAFKFTPSGGKITVNVTQTAIKGDTVFMRFTVTDTGCGITEEMRQRLFKPFEQDSPQTAQKYGGSGLGLSITKNLVDMMHGSITVDTEPGAGTSFIVDLPFGFLHATLPTSSDNFKNIRALVVDDSYDNCEYASLVLSRLNIEHDYTCYGFEAIDMLNAAYRDGRAYNVCLIDWKMNGLDGIALTDHIRQHFDADMVIIIVSAYDLSEVEDTARAAGANMFISKPLFQSTLFNMLMNLSGGKYTKLTANSDDYDFSGYRILLAEDNELNREIAVELLTSTGLTLDCAENGQIAVDMFANASVGTYDAILMDIQMPLLNGYEASKIIRGLQRSDAKSIPIIAMTANAFIEDVAASLSSGMNDHVAKPIDTEVLFSILKKHLKI